MAAEHKNALEALKAAGTVVVSDSGEFDKIRALRPEDATTNPSLIFQAAKLPEYKHVVDEAVAFAKASGKKGHELMELVLDKVRAEGRVT
jgi:transaldolase